MKSETVHGKLLEDISLANKIKSISPLSNTEDKTTVRIKKMATKEEVSDIMQSYKSRRTFQPSDFTGKTADNAREFISTFKNYCKLNNIDDQDKLLTFEMCLRGAAKCWFNGLPADIKQHFRLIEEQFDKNFLQNTQWLNTTRLENRKLSKTESAEKYIAELSDLAQLVGITDSELSKALIRGLPRPLKRHIISHNPTTLSETIQRILLREATLASDEFVDINAICDNTSSTIAKINQKVDRLEELISTTLQPQYPQRHSVVVCRMCGISGHYVSNCRRAANASISPSNNYYTLDEQRYTINGSSGQQFNGDHFSQ